MEFIPEFYHIDEIRLLLITAEVCKPVCMKKASIEPQQPILSEITWQGQVALKKNDSINMCLMYALSLTKDLTSGGWRLSLS